jgi:hypothetical protein
MFGPNIGTAVPLSVNESQHIMKVMGLIGVTASGPNTIVDELIGACRLDDWTVSTIKRAPDGLDLDQPGETSQKPGLGNSPPLSTAGSPPSMAR